jgi:hypothetical protein
MINMKTILVVFVVAAVTLLQHLPLLHAFAPTTTAGRTTGNTVLAPQRLLLWHGGSTRQQSSSLDGQESVNDPFGNERSNVSRKSSPPLHTTIASAFCTLAFGCCALMISPLGAGAVSGGGLDYANMDLSGQDFAGGNYKGKDFTQGTCYCAVLY